ncbi:MAG TPA: FecR family protein [Nevskiales bacterium]|nr:FecR family protein [Nevskiales bacterium]
MLLALLCLSQTATAAIGRIYFVHGGVYIQRGADRIPAEKDALLEAGDTLVTESDGRVQWRLADDSYFVLRPNSSYRIETYQFPEGGPAKAGAGKAIYELLKGGVRTLTGLIGKTDTAAYQAKMPVATMGIRGTDYTSIYCGDCSWAGPNIKSGLYVRVDHGEIEIINQGGSLRVKAGQYAYVASDSFAPQLLPEAPAVFLTWAVDFEFVYPGLESVIDRLRRIEPIEPIEPCLPVPSPNEPCP